MKFFQQFWRNSEGSAFIIVGFGILMLVGAVGVAVDVGRGQMAQTKLQNALDAAGLAAGSTVNSQDLNAEVTKYMNVNFSQGTLGAIVTNVTPVLNADGTLLTVTADATMRTSFMQIFNHPTMDLHAETQVTRTNKGMELAMVLDITGSMAGSKLDALKTSSKDLLEILFGTGKYTADNLWVGIVPFTMGVNTGPSHTNWLNAANYASLNWGPTSWRGCTEERWSTGRDVTDAPPTTEKFLAYYWGDDDTNNDWIQTGTNSTSNTTTLCGPTSASSCQCKNAGTQNCGTTTSGNVTTVISCTGSGSSKKCTSKVTTTTPYTNYVINDTHGPNTYCPVSEVTRLTNDRHVLETGVDNLVALGGTHIPVGMVWGWRMLSPDWRGLWGGSMDANNLPLDYNTNLMLKAVILMTDGTNTMYSFADGAYGYTGQNYTGMTSTPYTDAKAAARLDTKLSQICTSMKAKNIIVYTVLFEETDTNVKTLLRNCATQPDYFFDSPDEATLQQAFHTIGDSLANLRISK